MMINEEETSFLDYHQATRKRARERFENIMSSDNPSSSSSSSSSNLNDESKKYRPS